MKKAQKTIRFHVFLGEWLLRMEYIFSMKDFIEWITDIEYAAAQGHLGPLGINDSSPQVRVDPKKLYVVPKSALRSHLSLNWDWSTCIFYYPDPDDLEGIGIKEIKRKFRPKKARKVIRVRRQVRQLLLEYAKPQTKGNKFDAIIQLSFLKEKLIRLHPRLGASP